MSGDPDVWEVMRSARTIRRFTGEPVDDAALVRCIEAATWAPSGANQQAWRFVILRSPQARRTVAEAAALALTVIEREYRMTRPDDADDSRHARANRATYELHDRAGEFVSILCTYRAFAGTPDLLTGGSIYPAVQNLLLAARAQGLGACLTSWANYGGEALLREAVGVPADHLLAAHVVLGHPRNPPRPVRRRPVDGVVAHDRWDAIAPLAPDTGETAP